MLRIGCHACHALIEVEDPMSAFLGGASITCSACGAAAKVNYEEEIQGDREGWFELIPVVPTDT